MLNGELNSDALNFWVCDHLSNLRGITLWMRQNPRPANVLDVANHALGFAAKFGGALLQPAIEFVKLVLHFLYVGSHQGFVAELSLFMDFRHAEILAMNQFVETDLDMSKNGFSFALSFGRCLSKEGLKCLFDQNLFGNISIWKSA